MANKKILAEIIIKVNEKNNNLCDTYCPFFREEYDNKFKCILYNASLIILDDLCYRCNSCKNDQNIFDNKEFLSITTRSNYY